MLGRHRSATVDETAGQETATSTRVAQSEKQYDPRADDYRGAEVDREVETAHETSRDRFGGTNWGAAFFGWLVAVAITALIAGIIGAVATAVGRESDLTTDELADNAGTTGIVAAIAVVAILLI